MSSDANEVETYDNIYTELDEYQKSVEEELQRVNTLTSPLSDLKQLQLQINELNITEWESRINLILRTGIYHETDEIRLVSAKILELMIDEHLVPLQIAMPHLIALLSDPQVDIQEIAYSTLEFLRFEHLIQLPYHSAQGMRMVFALHSKLNNAELLKVFNHKFYALLNAAVCVSDNDVQQLAFEKIMFVELVMELTKNSGFCEYQQFLAYNIGNFPYKRLEFVAFAINCLQKQLKQLVAPIYDAMMIDSTSYTRESIFTCLLLHNLMSFLQEIYSIKENASDILDREKTDRLLSKTFEVKQSVRKQGIFDSSLLHTRLNGSVANQMEIAN